MPWKECHAMDERLRFVARLLEGEKMAPLCAELGISRKTGYKIFERYKTCGQEALIDRSRRPYRQANRRPAPIEATIVRLKREYPGWGAPKIRAKLRQQSSVTSPRRGGHVPFTAHGVERTLVCGLQGGIPPRESAVLLSADHHRFRQPVSARV